MARNAKATISLEVVGRNRVRAALTGVTADMRAAGAAQSGSSRSSAAAAVRADATRTQSAHRATQAITREAKAAERARVGGERAVAREAEKTARAQERASQRAGRVAARQRMQQQRDVQRSSQQGGGGFRSGVSDVAGSIGIPTSIGAGAAVAFGAMAMLATKLNAQAQDIVTAADRAAGRQDAPDAAVSALNLDTSLVRLGNQAFGELGDTEFNRRLDETRARIEAVARATNIEPGQLVEGLNTFQDTFSQFQFGVDSMEAIARAAESTGVPFNDLVGLVGETQRSLGVSAADTNEVLALMVQQGREGSVTPGQFARNFSTAIGDYQRGTGKGGVAGFREFGALAQVQAAGGGSPEEAATRLREMVRLLNDTDTLDRLNSIGGVDARAIRREGGSIPEIIDAIAGSRRLRNAETMSSVFKDTQGRTGIGITLTKRSGMHSLMDASSAAGQTSIDNGFRRVMGTTGEQNRNRAIVENTAVGRAGAGAVSQSQAFMDFDSAMRQQGGLGALFSSDNNPLARPMFEARNALMERTTRPGASGNDARAIVGGLEGIGSVVVPWIESLQEAITGVSKNGGAARTAKTTTSIAGSVDLSPATITAIGRAVAAASPDGPIPPVVGPGLGARTPQQRRSGVSPR
jgi:hypothetical protein